MKEKSTVAKMRAGKWLIPNISEHRTLQGRAIPGKVGSMEETRQIVDFHLLTHNQLPLDEEVNKLLEKFRERSQEI